MSQSIGTKVKTFFKSMMKPSPSQVFQAVKTLKPHVPMIKFRYGGGAAGHSRMSAPSSPAFSPSPAGAQIGRSAPTSPSKPNATVQLPIIEDWQLPQRYRRRPLDQVEIDYINRGGPE